MNLDMKPLGVRLTDHEENIIYKVLCVCAKNHVTTSKTHIIRAGLHLLKNVTERDLVELKTK